MMKKFAALAAGIVTAAVLAACSSFEIGATPNDVKIASGDTEAVAHVNADIWGIYVFGLPVISGSSVEPGKCVVFSDTVDTSNAISFLTRNTRRKLNASGITDVQSERGNGAGCEAGKFFHHDEKSLF